MNYVDFEICLGFQFRTRFPVSGASQVTLDGTDVGNVSSFAGSCHIRDMENHFVDYILSPNNIPRLPGVPGFPTGVPFAWLATKERGTSVTGNIGEAVAAIVAQQVFRLKVTDIAHLKVKGGKTPDYIMRFANTIQSQLGQYYPQVTVPPPDWWPVESKAANCDSQREAAIKRAFRQLAAYWQKVPDSAGFGVVVGYQYLTTSRQSQDVLGCLFVPKNQPDVQRRLQIMTKTQMKKAESDSKLTENIYGCE